MSDELKMESVQGFATYYNRSVSFWAFEHRDGNHTLQFESQGVVYGLQGVQRKDVIRVAAAMMRLVGGDVYDAVEDEESEIRP